MCCEWCCEARRDGGPLLDEDEVVQLVRQTVETFDFERYSVRVVPLNDGVDARMELWKQCLISEIIDDVKAATYEP